MLGATHLSERARAGDRDPQVAYSISRDLRANACEPFEGPTPGYVPEPGQDNCPEFENVDQLDEDTDTYGDACDNCALVENLNQSDLDVDGVGHRGVARRGDCGGV